MSETNPSNHNNQGNTRKQPFIERYLSEGEHPTAFSPNESVACTKSLVTGRSMGEQDTRLIEADLNPMEVEHFRSSVSKRYTLQSVIGSGGMGIVHLAVDHSLNGRFVAIKTIRNASASRNRQAFETFIEEMQNASKLCHPNIVHIYDSSTDNIPYLVMEYADSGNLWELIRQNPMDADQSVEIGLKIAKALATTHSKGILHRDVKPSNIVCQYDSVTKRIEPKLTDFGIALPLENALKSQKVTAPGTKGFIAPEILAGTGPIDELVDVYGFGVTFYQMVTGKFDGLIQPANAPSLFRELILKMTFDREHRYPSMLKVIDELEKIQKMLLLLPRRHLKGPFANPILKKGECYHCELENELTRKYCDRCGTALRVKCLSCGSSHAVWDQTCDGCGTRQDTLVREMRSKLQTDMSLAEGSLNCLDYSNARQLLDRVSICHGDPRFDDFQEWTNAFRERYTRTYNESLALLQREVIHAQQAIDSGDLESAIEILKSIPDGLQRLDRGEDPKICELLERVEKEREKIEAQRSEDRRRRAGQVQRELEYKRGELQSCLVKQDYRGAMLRLQEFEKLAHLNQVCDHADWIESSRLQIEAQYRESIEKITECIARSRQMAIHGDLESAINSIRSLPNSWLLYRYRQDAPTLGQWLAEFESLLKKQKEAKRVAKLRHLNELVVRLERWTQEARLRIDELEFDKAENIIEQLQRLCSSPEIQNHAFVVDQLRLDFENTQNRARRRLDKTIVEAEKLAKAGDYREAIFCLRRLPQAVLRLRGIKRPESGLELVANYKEKLAS